jgi:hypothetical protein
MQTSLDKDFWDREIDTDVGKIPFYPNPTEAHRSGHIVNLRIDALGRLREVIGTPRPARRWRLLCRSVLSWPRNDVKMLPF